MSIVDGGAGFAYLWSYEVRAGCTDDFERLYGPEGGWVQLFRRSTSFLGTDLLRDRDNQNRYVTVDRWVSEEAHRRFVSEHREEFEELDKRGEELTQNESLLGYFDSVGTRRRGS